MTSKIEVSRELLKEFLDGADSMGWSVAEKLRALLATPEAPRQEPVERKSDSWSKDWKEQGFNYCIETAIKALKYLADHPRPSGGESRYNAEHLIMTAQELALTRQELLIGRNMPAPLSPDHSGGAGKVVLPERRTPTLPGGAMTLEDMEWNNFLDKVKELNQ